MPFTHRIRHRTFLVAATALLATACGGGDDPTPPPVSNPVPGVTTVAPNEITQGANGAVLAVTGNDFVATSKVHWNGAERPTSYVNASSLSATLTAADLATAGVAQVTVVNPEPGGGTSNAMEFVVRVAANARPVVSQLTPDGVMLGSGETAVTVRGAGFTAESQVVISNGSVVLTPATTFTNATTLGYTMPANRLTSAGAWQVWVMTPAPGGGQSNILTFTVRNPVPTITALGQTTFGAGSPETNLTVDGTNFVPTSVVRLGGAARTTSYVNANRVSVRLTEADLSNPGTYAISVTNPAPGGGTSGSLSFTVVTSPPGTISLPSMGASAGRPGFSLAVDGSQFTATSVVHWNGASRPTTFVSGTRLLAAISSSDVAAPGTARITVVTPGSGGGTSNEVTMTVRTVGGSTLTDARAIDIKGKDLAYDPATGRMYVSVGSTDARYSNHVVAVDPVTGTVTGSTPVGSEPSRLALSDDGQFLWVAHDGNADIIRIQASTLSPQFQFTLPSGRVEEMLVLPGQPRALAMSRMNPGSSPKHLGVFIYDDGVQRPTATPGHTGSNSIVAAADGATLYGYNNESSDFGFRTMAVTPSGVTVTSTTGGLIGSYYTRIVAAGNRVYGTNGAIIDPARRTLTGSFTLSSSFAHFGVLPIPQLGRVIFQNGATLSVHDMNTLQLLGSVNVPFPVSSDHPANARPRLVRWGTDGIAFVDGAKLYLVRMPLAAQ